MQQFEDSSTSSIRSGRTAVGVLAVVGVLFAMREASAVVIPVLLAFFLALGAGAPVAWLQKKGVPRFVSIMLVVAMVALFVGVSAILVGSSLQELSQRAPSYQQKVRQQIDSLLAGADGSVVRDQFAEVVSKASPEQALRLAVSVLGGVGDLFGKAVLILFLMILMILEAPGFEARVERLGGSSSFLAALAKSVRSYLVIKTVTSLITGVVVGILLTVLGVNFAVLWGLLAFLLNYVPTVGSIFAAVPPVLMGLIQQGPGLALAVIVVFLVVNLLVGYALEPRVMGEGMGLSTVVVLLSFMFWGWLLGPVGMLLSVLLTTAVKIGLETREGTAGLAALLGAQPPISEESEEQ